MVNSRSHWSTRDRIGQLAIALVNSRSHWSTRDRIGQLAIASVSSRWAQSKAVGPMPMRLRIGIAPSGTTERFSL
ncbi:MAG: hypothetical protein QNJ54_10915 [Prochloraceae cyanobacterium]|nr:hypothetical protein [Prochloraceae cyanobacterium]